MVTVTDVPNRCDECTVTGIKRCRGRQNHCSPRHSLGARSALIGAGPENVSIPVCRITRTRRVESCSTRPKQSRGV